MATTAATTTTATKLAIRLATTSLVTTASCYNSETTYFNNEGVGDREPLDGDPCDGNGVFLLVHREVMDQGVQCLLDVEKQVCSLMTVFDR
ncbi:hypothetical protein Tco_0798628 [Tanacetum coccineum]